MQAALPAWRLSLGLNWTHFELQLWVPRPCSDSQWASFLAKWGPFLSASCHSTRGLQALNPITSGLDLCPESSATGCAIFFPVSGISTQVALWVSPVPLWAFLLSPIQLEGFRSACIALNSQTPNLGATPYLAGRTAGNLTEQARSFDSKETTCSQAWASAATQRLSQARQADKLGTQPISPQSSPSTLAGQQETIKGDNQKQQPRWP